MAGRKKAGDMHPHFAGGFGFEFQGKNREREAQRANEQLALAGVTWAIAYRLEQYAQAGKLSKMIKGHSRYAHFRKIRAHHKGDILAQIPARWVAYGPKDKPFAGDEWLHKNFIAGKTLAQILEETWELPSP